MLRVSSIDSSNMLLIFSSSWETIPSSSELTTNGILTAASTYAVYCASSGAAFPAVAFPFDEGTASRRSRSSSASPNMLERRMYRTRSARFCSVTDRDGSSSAKKAMHPSPIRQTSNLSPFRPKIRPQCVSIHFDCPSHVAYSTSGGCRLLGPRRPCRHQASWWG
ncbi:unnamed protein product [Parnassius apollo]|uniref:(apollo) hypothetical protein n=1 Tax=Parnassius apollo TaxID=110799 RepID=A0A8S3Y0D8_PARAO|nr:unnamed protein product [Parnassius apollo]